MTSFFYTVQLMPFGASVSLKYLSPVFAAIFAIFLLKEKIKHLQWLFFGMNEEKEEDDNDNDDDDKKIEYLCLRQVW